MFKTYSLSRRCVASALGYRLTLGNTYSNRKSSWNWFFYLSLQSFLLVCNAHPHIQICIWGAQLQELGQQLVWGFFYAHTNVENKEYFGEEMLNG